MRSLRDSHLCSIKVVSLHCNLVTWLDCLFHRREGAGGMGYIRVSGKLTLAHRLSGLGSRMYLAGQALEQSHMLLCCACGTHLLELRSSF